MTKVTMPIKMFDEIMTGKSEEKKWTDTDLCEFSEWCSENDWFFVRESNIWFNKTKILSYARPSNLREQWEIETGRRVK